MKATINQGCPSPSNATRIILVGCGAVVEELHAPALIELQKRGILSVSALFDPDQTRRGALLDLFPAAQELRDFKEVGLSHGSAALVASPARFHAEQAVACLEAGLSILCEKPMATCVTEAEKMIAAAQKAGRLLAVGHVRRHFATAQLIKTIIEKRRFGSMVNFRISEGGSFGWAAKSQSFFQRDSGGGGVMTDTGIHTLDLLLWWLGTPVSFDYEDDAMGGLEANCRLALDYGTFSGEVQLTRDYELPNGYFLEFEHAWIHWRPYVADFFDLGFPGSRQSLRGHLGITELIGGYPVSHRNSEPFSP